LKQIFQDLKTKKISIEELPDISIKEGCVLIRTHYSVISSGTEKTIIDTASKNLLQKAHARPDLVKQVIAKVKKDGLLATYDSVLDRLDAPIPLGYSASGVVLNVGEKVNNFNVGDRVAVAGAGYANHATINCVPENLVVKVPIEVSLKEAAYATIGSIAMQGVRVAKPQIGEYVAVSGLGLVGLTTAMILKANGCMVCGIDLDQKKIDLAKTLGLDVLINLNNNNAGQIINDFSNGRGVDHTVICASTDSNAPISLAGDITKSKGVVTVVGTVGMDIPRQPFYLKELELRLSMSYGPGRYDKSYEEMGLDYPYNYVRWTENRNMSSILNLIATDKLDFSKITTHVFKYEMAMEAYNTIKSEEFFVGIILDYDVKSLEVPYEPQLRNYLSKPSSLMNRDIKIGFIGLGNYASSKLIPSLKKNNLVEFVGLANATGISSKNKANKYKFSYYSANYNEIILNNEIDTIFISTRHSNHFKLSKLAIDNGKNVFVEKPPCINEFELDELIKLYENNICSSNVKYMVGLNRRFSPHVMKIKNELSKTKSKTQILYRVNGGPIPLTSWTHEIKHGSGMLIGEMCHFIDTITYLIGSQPRKLFAYQVDFSDENTYKKSDNIIVNLKFDNGSVATLFYNTLGNKNLEKEHIEIYSGGQIGVIKDFISSKITTDSKNIVNKTNRQDKGQDNMLINYIDSIKYDKPSPISFEEISTTMRVVFSIKKSIESNLPQNI